MRRNKRSSFLNAILLIFSLFFSIALVEIILRILPIQRIGHIPQYYFRKDELSGFDISENFPPKLHNFGECQYSLWSNELGCFDEPYRKDEAYALLVGDSLAWGYAPFNNKFATLLEKFLDYRVLKCGVAGYGTKQELSKIESIIKKTQKKPKLILVAYSIGNDLIDDYLYPGISVIDGYLVNKIYLKDLDSGEKEIRSDDFLHEAYKNLKIYGIPEKPVGINQIKRWLAVHSAIYNVIRRNKFIKGAIFNQKVPEAPASSLILFKPLQEYPWLMKAWRDHFTNLKNIKKFSERYNAKMLIIIIPSRAQLHGFVSSGTNVYAYDWLQPNKILKKFFDNEGISYLDLTLLFAQHISKLSRKEFGTKEDLYWRYDGHLNIKGNKLAGLLIAKYIINNNIIDIADIEHKRRIIDSELSKFENNKLLLRN